MVRVAQHQPHHRQQHQNPHQLQLHALLVQLQLHAILVIHALLVQLQLQPVQPVQLHVILVQLQPVQPVQLQPVGLVSYNPCTLYTQLQPVFIGWMPFKLIKILELLTKCRIDQSAS